MPCFRGFYAVSRDQVDMADSEDELCVRMLDPMPFIKMPDDSVACKGRVAIASLSKPESQAGLRIQGFRMFCYFVKVCTLLGFGTSAQVVQLVAFFGHHDLKIMPASE